MFSENWGYLVTAGTPAVWLPERELAMVFWTRAIAELHARCWAPGMVTIQRVDKYKEKLS